jgi:hypothetical protein
MIIMTATRDNNSSRGSQSSIGITLMRGGAVLALSTAMLMAGCHGNEEDKPVTLGQMKAIQATLESRLDGYKGRLDDHERRIKQNEDRIRELNERMRKHGKASKAANNRNHGEEAQKQDSGQCRNDQQTNQPQYAPEQMQPVPQTQQNVNPGWGYQSPIPPIGYTEPYYFAGFGVLPFCQDYFGWGVPCYTWFDRGLYLFDRRGYEYGWGRGRFNYLGGESYRDFEGRNHYSNGGQRNGGYGHTQSNNGGYGAPGTQRGQHLYGGQQNNHQMHQQLHGLMRGGVHNGPGNMHGSNGRGGQSFQPHGGGMPHGYAPQGHVGAPHGQGGAPNHGRRR